MQKTLLAGFFVTCTVVAVSGRDTSLDFYALNAITDRAVAPSDDSFSSNWNKQDHTNGDFSGVRITPDRDDDDKSPYTDENRDPYTELDLSALAVDPSDGSFSGNRNRPNPAGNDFVSFRDLARQIKARAGGHGGNKLDTKDNADRYAQVYGTDGKVDPAAFDFATAGDVYAPEDDARAPVMMQQEAADAAQAAPDYAKPIMPVGIPQRKAKMLHRRKQFK